jgi:uncharacterized membrane protein YdjX (TVP38/TMEM64 family)
MAFFMSKQRRQLLIRGVILIVLVAAIFALSKHGPQPIGVFAPFWEELEDLQETALRRERIVAFLSSLGPYSSAVFILLQALQVVISPIPGELTGVVGGYVYGTTYGFILSTLGLTLGSWVAFELASILGRPFVERLVKKRMLDKFEFVTTATGATICFLLFLLPGFPKDVLCYVLGLSRMRLGAFLIVSTIGRIPGTYLLTVQGASVRSEDYSTTIVIAVISVALLFFAYLYRVRLFHWIRSLHR